MASRKRASSAATALGACSALTAKQMECSLLAWLIMITLTPASRTVPKMLLAVPGTPTMPVPSTLISVTFSIVANPFTSPCVVRLLAVRCARGRKRVRRRQPHAPRLTTLLHHRRGGGAASPYPSRHVTRAPVDPGALREGTMLRGD